MGPSLRKTTTAAESRSRSCQAACRSPGGSGIDLLPTPADHRVSDFQHWPPWRSLVVATATELARFTGQDLIAPQTIRTRTYLSRYSLVVREAVPRVFHVLLDADEERLRQRIEGSPEAQAWRLAHLAEYRASRSRTIPVADVVVNTDAGPPLQPHTRPLTRYLDLEDRQAVGAARRQLSVRCGRRGAGGSHGSGVARAGPLAGAAVARRSAAPRAQPSRLPAGLQRAGARGRSRGRRTP